MNKRQRFFAHLKTIQANRPLLLGGIVLLSLIIIAVTSLAFVVTTRKAVLNAETAGQIVKDTLAKLISQEIEFRLEPSLLPADGKSTATLTVALNNKTSKTADELPPVQLEVAEGELTIVSREKKELFTIFLIRAGTKAGPAKLSIKAGLLEKPVSLTLFDPTPPPTPVIKSPLPESTLGSSRPNISGIAQKETKIILFTDSFENGQAETNAEGFFTLTPVNPLKNGPHLVRVIAENKYGVKSLPSEAIRITVDIKSLSVDLENLRLTPNPVTKGEIVNVFVPAAPETHRLFVIINGVQHELKDRYQSSVFSGRIIAPPQPGNYPIAIISQDAALNSTATSQAATLTVR